MVRDLNASTGFAAPQNLTNVNGTLFFSIADRAHGNELWKSDGTAAGTVLVRDINPGAAGSNPTELTAINGTLFFVADDGVHGPALWKSDGTAAGTVLVKDTWSGPSFDPSLAPRFLTNPNGTLFFRSFSLPDGFTLWKSDGTAAGTVEIENADATRHYSDPFYLTVAGGLLFFMATDAHGHPTLWRTDGTPAGTFKVGDVYPGNLTAVGNLLFFVSNQQVWKSDGTAAGTVKVKNIDPGGNSAQVSNCMALGGAFLFAAYDPVHGAELWKSDGTAAGTALLKEINPGAGSSDPYFLGVMNGALYFTANDGVHGNELWKTDGTAAGTVLVKDINPGGGSDAFGAVVSKGILYFAASNGTHGTELWRSDGTAGGTVLVQDINPGASPSQLDNLTDVNGTLFFAANDGAHGKELWKYVPSQPPLVGNGSPIQATERTAFRGTVAWFLDPAGPQPGAQYHALIDWGDGTTPDAATIALVNGKFTVTGSHTYARVGSYQATITLQRGDGSSVTVRSPVTVADAPLYAGRTFVRATTNQPFTGIVATFIDTNPLSKPGDFKATITWGDGHTSVGVIQPNAAGSFSVTGGNTYASAGTFPIIITIKEEGGITVTVQSIMRVTA
jgi:ELWxxDGT repeat protein